MDAKILHKRMQPVNTEMNNIEQPCLPGLKKRNEEDQSQVHPT